MAANTICSDNFVTKDLPYVYLTLSPISKVSWSGKVSQSHLVLNWTWKRMGKGTRNNDNGERNFSTLDGDWVGLFSYNVSNGPYNSGKGKIVTDSIFAIFVPRWGREIIFV